VNEWHNPNQSRPMPMRAFGTPALEITNPLRD